MGPIASANKILKDRHLENSLPIPLIQIAQSMGVRVFKDDALSCVARIREDDGLQIVFNQNEVLIRQRFAIAHCLGKIALKHCQELPMDLTVQNFSKEAKWRDQEANNFALALLIPESLAKTAFLKLTNNLSTAAETFQVSEVAMMKRLQQIGLIKSDRELEAQYGLQ